MSKHHTYLWRKIILLGLLALSGCTGSRPPIEGAWIKVGEDFRSEDPPLVKVLVDGRFAFGKEMQPDWDVWAGGGLYVLDGDRYLETITYHPIPMLVGETVIFDFRLENGAWFHEAEFEKGGAAFHIREVWLRQDDPRLKAERADRSDALSSVRSSSTAR